jgi:hypothetical protein
LLTLAALPCAARKHRAVMMVLEINMVIKKLTSKTV